MIKLGDVPRSGRKAIVDDVLLYFDTLEEVPTLSGVEEYCEEESTNGIAFEAYTREDVANLWLEVMQAWDQKHMRWTFNVADFGWAWNPRTGRRAQCWLISVYPVLDSRFQPSVCEAITFDRRPPGRKREAARLRDAVMEMWHKNTEEVFSGAVYQDM